MNKYSDNLKVDCNPTKNIGGFVDYSPIVDMRQSDVIMFVYKTHEWQSGDPLDIIIRQLKEGQSIGQGKIVFQIQNIYPEAGQVIAVDVKAEDLDVNNEYVRVFSKHSSSAENLDECTCIVVPNDDHVHFDKMGHYQQVFDRLHLTPDPYVAPV